MSAQRKGKIEEDSS
jgi:hypothetical protein